MSGRKHLFSSNHQFSQGKSLLIPPKQEWQVVRPVEHPVPTAQLIAFITDNQGGNHQNIGEALV